MNRFFVTIYLGMLIFLLLGFFLAALLFSFVFPEQTNTYSEKEAGIVELFQNSPENTWKKSVELVNLSQDQFRISLLTSRDIPLPHLPKLKPVSADEMFYQDALLPYNSYTLVHLGKSHYYLKFNDIPYHENIYTSWVDIYMPSLLLFLTLAFGLYLQNRMISKPIDHLTTVVEKFGRGQLDIRAKQNLVKPLKQLGEGFNQMAELLNEKMTEQQIMMGAIPHELRSPLGRLRFALDLTRQSSTIEDLRARIEIIDGFADEMQQAVSELLELNQLYAMVEIPLHKISLNHLLDDIIKRFKRHHPEINFSQQNDLDTEPMGNTALISRALENLISNAIKHCKKTVQLSVWREAEMVIIQLDDDGEGVAEADRKKIFQPFYTADSSRNSGGIGLGLALVRLIMLRHGGGIEVADSSLGGARFRIFWTFNATKKYK